MNKLTIIATALKTGIWLIKNWYTIWEKCLRVIGDIKVFKHPCWVHYNPAEYDYEVRGEKILEAMDQIQAGDIILRHYKHYLDSYLIPGKYSHSGVYIGDNKIIHAVAEGVKKISIIDFCQADGILILRPKAGQAEAIKKAYDALGKEYDFKFNSKDKEKFYCHELSAHCYSDAVEIEAITPTFMGFKLKFLKGKYLAESFIKNKFFEKVAEF